MVVLFVNTPSGRPPFLSVEGAVPRYFTISEVWESV